MQNKDTNKVKELQKEIVNLKKELKNKDKEIEYLHWFYGNELNKINFTRFLRLNFYYLRYYGFWKYIKQVLKNIFGIFSIINQRHKRIKKRKNIRKQLKKILKKNKKKQIFVFYPGYDWYMKMYQRPQHMAVHFSEENILFFYCTANWNDKVDGFEHIKDNLYVTNEYELLKEMVPHYTLYLYANENGCYLNELKDILNKGNNLLYEYIDDLHEDLTGISKELLERHKWVLKNKKIPVVATASYLYKKAAKIRGSENNILLSTNGVVYEDFHITSDLAIPEKIKKIVAQKKNIIGYYGALAKWFDYDLIEKMAKEHPEWNILLIGIIYDDSFAKYNYFKKLKNVYYIGTVDYKELVKYGNCCNVLTIPFLINEITLSTSPVKVFEYMSMEKPIVTTDLPECRKYKSVMIAKDHDDFIEKVKVGIKLQNDEIYKEILRKEALENTWTNKVKEILEFINKNRKEK